MKRTPLRKISKSPITKLKKRLWQLCREITFIQHGSDCYTCSTLALIGSNRHLGHFISSSVCSASMRYDLDNLRPQCYACNIFRSGNWLAFEEHLKRDGIDPEALKQRNRDSVGLKADSLFYGAYIAKYEALLASLTQKLPEGSNA